MKIIKIIFKKSIYIYGKNLKKNNKTKKKQTLWACVGNKEQILWKLWISITKKQKKNIVKKTFNKLTTNLGSVRPIIAMLYTTTTAKTTKTYTKQHRHSQTKTRTKSKKK